MRDVDLVAVGGLVTQARALKFTLDIARRLGLKTVAGGGIISSEPKLMMEYLQPTWGIIGEGEESVVELLAPNDPWNVKGVAYFKDGEVCITEARKPIASLDALPLPAYDVFDFAGSLDRLKPSDNWMIDALDHPREYPLLTSRSCPYLCTFCWHTTGQKYRTRSLDAIFAELEEVIPKYRINLVTIYDECFSMNRKRVLEFCSRFASKFPGVVWACQTRVSDADTELITTMRDSGCFQISYGFESHSQLILDSMQKHITTEQIDYAWSTTRKVKKIICRASLIVGDPAETMATFKESMDWWKQYGGSGIYLGFLIPAPDSVDYRYAVEKGIIKDKLNFLLENFHEPLNLTAMPWKEWCNMMTQFFLITFKHNSQAVPTLDGDGVRVTCPCCKSNFRFGNYKLPPGYFWAKQAFCRNCQQCFYLVSPLRRLLARLIPSRLPWFSYPFYRFLHKFLPV